MLKLVAVALVAAVLGGLIGAAVYAAAFGSGDQVVITEKAERGALIHFGTNFPDIKTTPFCVQSQHFCLVQNDSGQFHALYTYATHVWSREEGCEIVWRPDYSYTDPQTGETSQGWFKANCSGSTFRYDGEFVFGPGGRDMDQYPVSIEKSGDSESLVVDTRYLICGRSHATGGDTPPCVKAPAPQ